MNTCKEIYKKTCSDKKTIQDAYEDKDDSLIVESTEIEQAKDLVIEALNTAFDSWKQKHARNGSAINLHAMAMVEKTQDLVVRYISSMLGGKKDLPIVGF